MNGIVELHNEYKLFELEFEEFVRSTTDIESIKNFNMKLMIKKYSVLKQLWIISPRDAINFYFEINPWITSNYDTTLHVSINGHEFGLSFDILIRIVCEKDKDFTFEIYEDEENNWDEKIKLKKFLN